MISKTVEIVRRIGVAPKVRFEKTSYKLFGFITIFVKYLQMEHN